LVGKKGGGHNGGLNGNTMPIVPPP
jgi:hypothetical protein